MKNTGFKICHILPRLVPGENGVIVGGYATNCIEISLALRDVGNDVWIIAPVPEEKIKSLKEHPVESILEPVPLRGKGLYARGASSLYQIRNGLKKFLNKQKIDVIHSHSGTYPYALSSCQKRATNIKKVHTLYCPIKSKGGIYGNFWDNNYIAKSVLSKLNNIIAITDNVYQSLLNAGMEREKLICIPMALNEKFYSSTSEENNLLESSRTEGALKLLFVGNASHEKGLVELIDAVHVLKKRGKKVRLTAALENQSLIDEYTRREVLINEKISELSLEEEITLIGLVESIGDLYRESDILVVPWNSNRGPSDHPRVAMEAMAIGKPIITTPLEGCKELLEYGRLGNLTDGFDGTAIADTIQYVMRNRIEASRKCVNGQEKARSFSREIVTENIIKLYSDLLDNE